MTAPLVVATEEQIEELVRRAVRAELEARDRAANQAPEWLDARGAALLLKVSTRTMANLAKSQRLPSTRVGRLLRFRRSDVLAFLERSG